MANVVYGSSVVVLLGMAAGALAGCRGSTEIDVEVSTNVPCTQWTGAAIAVGLLGRDFETKPAASTTATCRADGHVGTLVAIPKGADNANVAFRVVGAVGTSLEGCAADAGAPGCIVARRALNFIPHETLNLAVALVSACEGIACDPLTTCVEGECRPAAIPDPGQCASQTCGEGVLPPADGGVGDASLPSDGGALEAGTPDATLPPDATAPEDGGSPEAAPPGTDASAANAGCGANCSVSAGDFFSCAARDGGVACWGQNVLDELGNGTTTDPDTQHPVVAGGAPLRGALGVISGTDTACAFLDDAGVACWGASSPLGVPSDLDTAQTLTALAGARAAAIGGYHMCWESPAGALLCQCQETSTGETVAYGADSGAVTSVALPAGVAGSIAQLATSTKFTCILTTAGAVYCLGDDGVFESDPTAAGASPLTAFKQVVLPGNAAALEIGLMVQTACARTTGHVYCWGDDTYGENGSPQGLGISEVTYAGGAPLADAVQLTTGSFHGCALVSGGHLACWGNDDYAELGRGGPALADGGGGFSNTAALVVDADGGAFAGVTGAAAGSAHTCAIKNDGSVWCWGSNVHGELGQASGDYAPRSTPTLVK
ncbi:MAG TPA: hypothetical protein VGI39_32490 [Polyangiaceae bacterium]|jgi:alpha-tubulin suppressor-like RCC1 family protein